MAGGNRVFEFEVQQSAKAFSLYYQRMREGSTPPGETTRFKQKSPYDGYFCFGGLFVPVELKSSKEHGRFPDARVDADQKLALDRVLHFGACPFLFLNMRRKMGVRGKLVPHNRAWAFPWVRWPDLKREMEAAGRVSIPYQWFEEGHWFAEIPRLPKNDHQPPVWDLAAGIKGASRFARDPRYDRLLAVLEEGAPVRSWETGLGISR